MRARAPGRAARRRGLVWGWGRRRLTISAGSRQPLGCSGGSRGAGMPVLSANRSAKRQERGGAWPPGRCLKLGG